jgi:hypothetical protein
MAEECVLMAPKATQSQSLGIRRAKGHVHQIADAPNACGITTPRGGQWYAKSANNVLARP